MFKQYIQWIPARIASQGYQPTLNTLSAAIVQRLPTKRVLTKTSSSSFSSNADRATDEVKDTVEEKLPSEPSKPQSAIVVDPSESPTVMKFGRDAEHGYKVNTEIELQLKDNPLALQILTEGRIDLRDERVNVSSLTLEDSKLLQGATTSKLRQINFGDVSVLPKDSVLLEDIDVHNIPQDKDIVIDKKEKILYAVGKKIEGKKSIWCRKYASRDCKR